MKELEFIEIIKNFTNNEYMGDDCAYLKDFGIVITQDNFIQDIHFKTEWATPYQIGYKATIVNISDILASGAKPEYITVGLSLPSNIDNFFIKELYRGINDGLYGAKIVGGDITGADKIMISITAIGSTKGRNISSRNNAKIGHKVIVSGEFGSSAAGLSELINNSNNQELINEHLEPKLSPNFSQEIATHSFDKYAMMDTSDGLADALYKIADSSNVTLKIDYNKIPHNRLVNDKKFILYGGEDYNLIATVPEDFLKHLNGYFIIGEVIPQVDDIKFFIDDTPYYDYSDITYFDHFKPLN